MQPLGDMTFNHGITKLRTLSQFSQKYNNQTWLEYMIPLFYVTWFIITRFSYSYMSFLYVTWSSNLLKRHSSTSKKTINSKLGEKTYKNERLAYLHMTWVNHAKVIKATAPKVSFSTGHVIFDYMIWKMKRAYATFTKAVRHQIL